MDAAHFTQLCLGYLLPTSLAKLFVYIMAASPDPRGHRPGAALPTNPENRCHASVLVALTKQQQPQEPIYVGSATRPEQPQLAGLGAGAEAGAEAGPSRGVKGEASASASASSCLPGCVRGAARTWTRT